MFHQHLVLLLGRQPQAARKGTRGLFLLLLDTRSGPFLPLSTITVLLIGALYPRLLHELVLVGVIAHSFIYASIRLVAFGLRNCLGDGMRRSRSDHYRLLTMGSLLFLRRLCRTVLPHWNRLMER